jgi:uncharacterized membrane protein
MPPWDDQRMDQLIGLILRAGVLLATALVLGGEVIHLARHASERPDFSAFAAAPTGLGELLRLGREAPGRGLIELGLLVLVATPVARVAFSVLAFAAQRDWVYVAVTVVVLALLGASLASGSAAAAEVAPRPAQPAASGAPSPAGATSAAAIRALTSSRSRAPSPGP